MTSSSPRPWTDLSRPPLRGHGLRAALVSGPGAVWRELEVLPSTGSTNADVAQRARDGAGEGLVLVTDDQRAGRGRLGRRWTAPPRSGLAVSVLLRPAEPAPGDRLPGGRISGDRLSGDPCVAGSWPGVDQARWSWLPLLAGLAVVDTLTRICGLPARLKWPNDVLVPADGLAPARSGTSIRPSGEWHKVCGILAEAITTPAGPAVVLGTGINVSQRRAELPAPTATSLALAGAAVTDRDTVLRSYLRALADRYRVWREASGDPRGSGIAPAYREACVTIGCPVAVHLPAEEPVTGVAEGVDDDGRLLVATAPGGVRALAAGDVVHVRPRD